MRLAQHHIRAHERRARRVRARLRGDSRAPRLSVFRSHRHITAQLVDDTRGITLASASDLPGTDKTRKALSGVERAKQVGVELAQQAKGKGIHAARFDRGRYRYHGLVAAVAVGARSGGLIL